MYSSPTTFVAKLLAAMQVLMTLDVPLSTTVALPVTSKPIESTVENLAWQAWIELPPEQKQQVKSRKVTPKSIFTLPLRVECPEGHKKVDSKCIPIAIGSNDVLIDLNALGLLVGSTQTEDVYDYDDIGEELSNPLAYGSEISAGEAVKSSDGLAIDLKPPAKDEPLKFNIFQNKFHIFHEEPLEDYAGLSNEGLQSSEKEQNINVTTPSTKNVATTVTALNDSVHEPSDISENLDKILDQTQNFDNANKQIKSSLHLDDHLGFRIEAISVPAAENHSSIQLLTPIIDMESTTALDKLQEYDLTTLLQTESLMPLLNHTTATTLFNSEILPLTGIPLSEPNDSSSAPLSVSEEEEITTLTTPMERNAMKVNIKQEYTRSVTLNPFLPADIDGSGIDVADDTDQPQEAALEIVTNDDTFETTTPIQLDDTTIIESHSSSPTTLTAAAPDQQELKALLIQEEQAVKSFEEWQRMRTGHNDQPVVLKKSKVQPVEVLSTTTEATTAKSTTSATTAASLPTATKSVDELLSATAEVESETETATPLLTVHNENENNDRFYYRQFAKQDNELNQSSAEQNNTASENTAGAASAPVAVTVTGQPAITRTTTSTPATIKSCETETIPLTSEIDLAEELRLINELVKGIRKPTTTTTATSAATTTSTTPLPATTTTITLADNVESSSSHNSLSESKSPVVKKSPQTTEQIWTKILPLLTTSTMTPMPKNSTNESFSESQQEESNVAQTFTSQSATSSSERSNRNSKIIRINGFNRISAAKFKNKDFTTTTATTTMPVEDATANNSPASSSTENFTYEPYWWLPVSWRPDKPTSTETPPQEQHTDRSEQQSLLLRFWSAYVPKTR